jgi:hypothetical protein
MINIENQNGGVYKKIQTPLAPVVLLDNVPLPTPPPPPDPYVVGLVAG